MCLQRVYPRRSGTPFGQRVTEFLIPRVRPGITLTQANHCVLLDSSWNPHDDLQAIGRAHRVGQKKKVTVSALTFKHTLDLHVLTRPCGWLRFTG